MRTLTLLLVLSLCTCVRAQTAFTNLSETAARDLAAKAGTFVIIDFYANWCGPCKVMDEKVWAQDTVQTLQGNFVNIRIDGSTSNAGMMRYGIKAIPALIIMDANGKEFFRKVGYMRVEEVTDLLDRFPADMRPAYAADLAAEEKDAAFNAHLLRAQRYQEAARTAKGSVAGRLANTSSDALKDARKSMAQNKDNPENLMEYLALMDAENLLLKGRAKKALKALAAIGEDVNEKHAALACYLKGVAYRKTGKPELAQDCYDQLLEAPDNEEFLAMYRKEEQ